MALIDKRIQRLQNKNAKLEKKIEVAKQKQQLKANRAELKSVRSGKTSSSSTKPTTTAKPAKTKVVKNAAAKAKAEGLNKAGVKAYKRVVDKGKGTKSQQQFVKEREDRKTWVPMSSKPASSKPIGSGIKLEGLERFDAKNNPVKPAAKPVVKKTVKKSSIKTPTTKKKVTQPQKASSDAWKKWAADMKDNEKMVIESESNKKGSPATNNDVKAKTKSLVGTEDRVRAKEAEAQKRKQEYLAKQQAARKRINEEQLKKRKIAENNAKSAYAYSPHTGTGYRQYSKGGKTNKSIVKAKCGKIKSKGGKC